LKDARALQKPSAAQMRRRITKKIASSINAYLKTRRLHGFDT
jgi:hypothetical protein